MVVDQLPKGTEMYKLPEDIQVGDRVRLPGYTTFQIIRETGYRTLRTARCEMRLDSDAWSTPLEVKVR